MEYKDIKTADELESWYAEKEDILEGYVRDYAVPFGNVYHLDSPGYVSEERWCDTLPSDRERSTFMALQNGVSTKEIIEHKDEFGWIDRMAMSSVADDYAECYMTQAGPDYLDEQEIMNVREQYPELIDSNGEIVWNDPDFVKRGVTFDVENFGEKYKIELVCDSYLDNGSLYVGAYDVTPESDNFGERWADISVNLNNPCQNDRTVFLDMNNLYNPAIIEAIYGLGTVEDIVSHSGSCSYPAFTFDADVISQMRNTQEFMDANTPDDYKLVAVKAITSRSFRRSSSPVSRRTPPRPSSIFPVNSMAFSPARPSRIRRNSMPSSICFRSTRLRTTRYQIKSVYSSCLSRCTGRMTHLRLSRRISVSRTPAVLSSTIALRSPAIPRMNSWT